jgi:hypothetical protein
MNNTFIILLFSTFLVAGCDRTYDTLFTSKQVLTNTENCDVVYIISTDVGNDTIYSKGNDTDSVTFKKNGVVDFGFTIGPYYLDVERVNILSKLLYSINDTAVYIRRYGDTVTESDSVFFANTKFISSGSVYDITEREELIFTNDVRDIMQKDYTMLEKFKGYYQK